MLTAKMIPADGCVMGFIVRKGIELVYVAVVRRGGRWSTVM